MLSNAYFLAKIRFDTAENEPAKNLQNFAKFANFADPNPLTLTRRTAPPPGPRGGAAEGGLPLGPRHNAGGDAGLRDAAPVWGLRR